DLLGRAVDVQLARLSGVELDVVQAEVVNLLERLIDVELAEGVALAAEREAAERVVLLGLFVLGPQEGRGGGEAEGGGAGALEEAAAGRVRTHSAISSAGCSRGNGRAIGVTRREMSVKVSAG